MRSLLAPLFIGALTLAACSDDPVVDTGTLEDTGTADSGVDTGVPVDATTDSGVTDTGVVDNDGGGFADALPGDIGDGGTPLPLEMEPGSHVTFAAGRIEVMSDDYASVTTKLGAGTRGTGTAVRTYAWTVDGAEVTIWFANTNLDTDDVPPTNVDGTDRVLWIAVGTGYTGRTPEAIGVASTKAQVEAAYGVAPRESTIAAPNNGTLAQYYTRGILVAYDTANMARTVTIARDYLLEPNAEIDVEGPRLRFPGFDLEGCSASNPIGCLGGGSAGTSKNTVTTRLGQPDSEGEITVGGQDLDTLSYAFIGLEIFFVAGNDNALFLTVHTPYYGTTSTGEGIGSTRTVFETYLTGRGYGAAEASSNAQLFCYTGSGGDKDVGVTYTTDTPALVSSVIFPLLNCP